MPLLFSIPRISVRALGGLLGGLLLAGCARPPTDDPVVSDMTPSIESFTLSSSDFVATVTPKIGGRVLEFSLPGAANLLLVGDAVAEQPSPSVSAEGEFIPYQGHITWVGPQSGWWKAQDLNPARREAGALWPPDPWLVQAAQEVEVGEADRLVLRGPPSPVSGLQLRKTFAIDAGTEPESLVVSVEATNIRSEPVSWGIWFNTRVPPSTRVYVPLANPETVRIENRADGDYGPLAESWEDGLYSLDLDARKASSTPGQRGKAFLDPAAGWIAAFREGQCFIIRFPLEPRSAIHPEQAQVELYLDYLPDRPEAGLLELEVHAPFRTLAAHESMTARESWLVLPYSGPSEPKAHRAFLRELSLLQP